MRLGGNGLSENEMTDRVGPRRGCGFLWLVLAGVLVFGAVPVVHASNDGLLGDRAGSTPANRFALLRSAIKDPTLFWTVPRVAWVTGGLAIAGLIGSFGWRYHSVARLNRRLTQQAGALRAVLDNVDQGISLFDADLKSVAFNDRFIELLDLPTRLKQVGISYEEYIRIIAARGEYGPGDADDLVRRRMETAWQFKPRQFLRQRPNGDTIDIRRNPIPDGGFVTTYTDITDRTRAEDALRISEQQLSEAQRIGRIGHWRYIPELHKFECSDAFYQIYGWDPHHMDATYAAITAAVHPEDRERMGEIRKDAGARKAAYTCEFRIVRPDSEVRVIRGEGRPEFDDQGRLVSFFGVNQDVTEQKSAEESLLRERTRAELANRAKSEFLANMSHEIRTPLNAIIGFSDIMEQQVFGPVGNSRYGAYVSDIHKSAQHLLGLVNDILDISAIEAGEMALSPIDLDVNEVFKECIRFVHEQARMAEVALMTDPLQERMTIYADHRSVRQILLNLLSNAIKFTPPGGRVSIGAAMTHNTFAIIVSDTGIGIPSQELPNITQPFETGNNNPLTSKKGNPYIRPEGTGLGLAIVRSLAILHDGDLDIESQEGVGTTVRVWFPRTRRAAA